MIPWLLNFVYMSALVLLAPVLLVARLIKGKRSTGLWRRLIGVPPTVDPEQPVLWLHAVSVGETLLLRPVLERLRRDHPDLQCVVSVSTATAMDVAEQRLGAVARFFAPFDFTWANRRVLNALRPRLVVLVEVELWPNLLLECRRRSIPVAVLNARMSDGSFAGYRRLRWFFRRPLSAIRWWGAQTPADADRIAELCQPATPTITVTGSIKYDGAVVDRHPPPTLELRRLIGLESDPDAIVWLAGSTSEPEEAIVLDAYRKLHAEHPTLRLLLAPRHPERADSIARLIEATGFAWGRRSRLLAPITLCPAIILWDTVGELSAAWGLADLGFVGGSLECRRGGQSMIEPAALGVPICFGPSTANFRDTVRQLLEADAAIELQNRSQLAPVLQDWLSQPAAAQAMGQRARAVIRRHQGAIDRSLGPMLELLDVPRPLPD